MTDLQKFYTIVSLLFLVAVLGLIGLCRVCGGW